MRIEVAGDTRLQGFEPDRARQVAPGLRSGASPERTRADQNRTGIDVGQPGLRFTLDATEPRGVDGGGSVLGSVGC